MGLDQEEADLITVDMSSKKKELLTSAMKRTNEWFASFSPIYLFMRIYL